MGKSEELIGQFTRRYNEERKQQGLDAKPILVGTKITYL
jgi:hypothetical protein